MEVLERRLLLNTYTVTNLADDNRAGTLRVAVEQALANGGANTITFDPSLSGTIELLNAPTQNGPLDFTGGNTTITDSGAVAVDGNDDATIFEVESGATLSMTALTAGSGGNYFGPANAGDIYNNGILNLNGCNIQGEARAQFHNFPIYQNLGFGGGIYNDVNGTLNVANGTTVTGYAELGGAIYNSGGTVSIANSTISGTIDSVTNVSAESGGAILNTNGGTVTISSSTITGTASIAGGGICNEADSTINDTGSTINGCTAGYWGGGIANYANGTVNLNGTTLSSDTANLGGAIFNYTNALLIITNGTI